MNRLLGILLLLVVASVTAADQPHGADIRFETARDEAAWVGERVAVNLEIWTDALSFAEQSFRIPDVTGAYLMQTDTSTLKLNEVREGVDWQGLRYTLSLWIQREGRVTIPAFEVVFSTRQGYGSESQRHVFMTPELAVEARLPPGAEAGALLVSSADFTVDSGWQPAPDDEGMLEMQTGDALTLTVTREASNVPGMVFEPLPPVQKDGLGVYVDPPGVEDRVVRGSLTGRRVDRITLICERPGRYRVPELRFQWWDPATETLNVETTPPVQIEVTENPAWGSAQNRASGDAGARGDRRWLWIVAVGLLLWWPGLPVLRGVIGWFNRTLSPRRLQPLNPEPPKER